MNTNATREEVYTSPGIQGVKQIIAIASGKGGVGKSTVSVNLAIALKQSGAKVGLLDADIYGPSQVGMLGSKREQPEVSDNAIIPTKQHGISFMSMGLLTDEDSPVIWRAPIAMKMIHQFLGGVIWGELDYLLIDLPPGTGDVQLTLAQQAQLTGAIIVTTPQDVALSISRKGLRMFEQVKVPIIGIVENMSGFICSHCGEETAIFNKGGGKKMAESIGVPFLGALPLDPKIMTSGESGIPILEEKSSDSPLVTAIMTIAKNTQSELKKITELIGDKPNKFEIGSDGKLHLGWNDGREENLEAYHLRINCPCASCVDEDTGKRTLDPKSIPLDIGMSAVHPVGNYAVAFNFADGHTTGIFSWELLANLADEKKKNDDKQSFSI